MTTRLPDAGLVAWWATAWLRREAVTDLVLDALAHLDVPGGWLAFNALALDAGSAVVIADAGTGLVPERLDGG